MLKLFTALVCVLLLIGCNGGGGGSDSDYSSLVNKSSIVDDYSDYNDDYSDYYNDDNSDNDDDDSNDIAPIPEPSTFVLLGMGIAALAAERLRRKKQ